MAAAPLAKSCASRSRAVNQWPTLGVVWKMRSLVNSYRGWLRSDYGSQPSDSRARCFEARKTGPEQSHRNMPWIQGLARLTARERAASFSQRYEEGCSRGAFQAVATLRRLIC